MTRLVKRQSQQASSQSSSGGEQQPTPNQAAIKPLWPKAIEVIGGTGEYESGKTTFGLTICPGPDTLYYDFENSGASYEADLGFVRIDVPGEMLKKFPQGGYKPVDVFEWWINHIRSQPPGQYRLIMADPASDIEQGITDWVITHPRHFNRTPAQYIKMQGLMWGDMKAYWKTILADIAARCETFYFTTHMANVWKGDKPSKERKAKGKETLFEMASLYLKFERKKDKDAVPSAVVLKSRLSKITINQESEEGEVTSIPLLPPRLPKATPAAVRRYMLNPPDYANLKPEELIGEQALTADEKLLLQAEIASANRDAALADNEREERQGNRLGRVKSRPVSSTSATDPVQAGDEEVPSEETQGNEEVVSDEAHESDSNESESSNVAGEVANDESAGQPAKESSPTVAEVLQNVHASPRAPRYPSPDEPVTKPMLAALRRTIARFIQHGGQQEAVMRSIKKRNQRAMSEADLTQGQAEDLDAAFCMLLDGPHAETDTPPVAASQSAQPPQTTQQTQPTHPAEAQNGQEVKARKPRTKRGAATTAA